VFIRSLLSQDPEAGITVLNGSERLLRITSYRPLDSAAYLLAEDYQIDVNAEDPSFACPDDLIDSRPSRKNPLAAEHAYLPKGGSFELRFSVGPDRRPVAVTSLLQQVVITYSQHFPFQYRLRQDGADVYSFVPFAGRDSQCHMRQIPALLDHEISITKGSGGIYEAVAAFEKALSLAAGEHTVINTQSWLNRVPNLRVSLDARNEPARDVLLHIIKATHYKFYWLVREQPLHQGWVINLLPLTRRIVREPGGGFHYPWTLWPGATPRPTWPAPKIHQ
jgi:hypothetical protein